MVRSGRGASTPGEGEGVVAARRLSAVARGCVGVEGASACRTAGPPDRRGARPGDRCRSLAGPRRSASVGTQGGGGIWRHVPACPAVACWVSQTCQTCRIFRVCRTCRVARPPADPAGNARIPGRRCRTCPCVHGARTPGPGAICACAPPALTPRTADTNRANRAHPPPVLSPQPINALPTRTTHPHAPTPTHPAINPTRPATNPTRPSTPPQTPANLVDTPSAHAFHSTLVHGNVVRPWERPGTVACRRRSGVHRRAAT